MYRVLLFLFCFTSLSVYGADPLQLDKRIGITTTETKKTPTTEEKVASIQAEIEKLKATEKNADDLLKNFNAHKQSLAAQLTSASIKLAWSNKQDLNQQASMAYLRLSELKEIEVTLSSKINGLIKNRDALPGEISDARDNLQQHQKNPIIESQNSETSLLSVQRTLYDQTVSTLEAELASSQKRIELNQLQLQLVRQQLAQQEALIEDINSQIAKQRQQKTSAAIADSQIQTDENTNPLTLQLSQDNKKYGLLLQQLTNNISLTVSQQEKAEKQYQVQAKQLASIQQQIGWIKLNSAFGEQFLQILQSLPKPPDQEQLQTKIANARLARYQLEQSLNINSQQLAQATDFSALQQKLLNSQKLLLTQLLQSYDQYLSKLADLRVSNEQLTQQYLTLKNTLNEHLFWVPNASSISKLWGVDLLQSWQWLTQQAPWQQLKSSFKEQNTAWSWWIIIVVLSLVLQDILTPKFKAAVKRDLANVGNVTQDKFINTFSVLTNSLSYSLIKPSPIIVAGIILYLSPHNLASAMGMALSSIGLFYLLYRVAYLLALDKGLLISHFKGPRGLIRTSQIRLRQFIIMSVPFLGVMGFTQILDNSLVRNSIGRGAFIIFCIMLFWFYKDILSLSKRYSHTHQNDKNKRLIQKFLWIMLMTVPPACAILAFQGYYYTAFQMLLQLQLSLLFGLGFLMTYQLIKRWMLIERRRIAFERAKAKRAEQLAQREKEDSTSTTNEQLETYEEPEVDLETISSQSLGLVRSLLLLAFLASLIGLWTQTHTALFSLLDGVTLWSSNSTINGMEQQLPITLKSLLLGIIIVSFSLMIATNLPGLMELILLQKLDLSPGTGFAITTVSRYLVVFFGILAGFSTLGMEWSKLQWLVAALSVGLGFGLQEIFANFISGLIILFEKPVRIGDTVTIRDLTGTVSKIQIRATTIIDWDRKEIIVPNKAFITEQLVNWSLSDPITRVIIDVSVARDSDPSRVEAALYQAVQECEDALKLPEPEVWFAGFGQHTQNFEVRAYAKEMSARWPLRHKLHKLISKKLRENQLELAYPQLEVHINNTSLKDNQGLIRT
ncbi:mechanosensitive ion channel domain-containing protein [uncultured Shewanella sp.]|uniref:mechanosensitive ion channel domain-containing protein n=1 Tax=uncultured Shewanella sp. TaxID=173975 RepID=UPI0026078E3C|nr:mechanosensitive ion channel domain-containing protein [uncultured Shewanella sp.]